MLEGSHRFNKKIIRGNLCCPCSHNSATDLHKFPRIIFADGWLLVEDKGGERSDVAHVHSAVGVDVACGVIEVQEA